MKINFDDFEYKNPTYEKNGTIKCEWKHPQHGWIPFTATPYDCEEHGRKIFEYLSNNADIKPYEPPPPPSQETVEKQMRSLRNTLISLTDWAQLPDVPEETKLLWKEYRQELRDVPQQSGFPFDIVWPIPPENAEQVKSIIEQMIISFEEMNEIAYIEKQSQN